MRRLSQIVVLLLLTTSRLSAQSPHGENLSIDCSKCHSPAGWNNATLIWVEAEAAVLKHKGKARVKQPLVDATAAAVVFKHDSTEFPLEGAHAKVDCKSCHATLVFDAAPMDCASCHTDVHGMSVGNDCARCHTSVDWIVNTIPELHEQNGFALVGAHGNLSCTDCHTSGNPLQFDRIGNDCFSCHQDDYQTAKAPDHLADGFSTDCIQCHDPMGSGWHTTNVVHDFFPLTMGHDIQDCNQCHVTGNFSDASPECLTCHQQDFNSTTNPNHQAAGFSTDCATCHSTNPGWSPTTYDHAVWPLLGSHIPVSCAQCHQGNYANTPNTCEACHLTDYNATTDPNHVTAGFPTDCAMCHDEGSWGSATFDHNATSFPLTGMHTNVNCIECHAAGYTNTPTNCDACHMTDFNGTVEPNHAQANFSTDCTQCHTPDGWTPSSFDHTAATGWALNGSHQNVNCNQCHAAGYANTPNTCEACHLTDYANAANPNHAAAGFPMDCAMCHDEIAWNSATFDHGNTGFPLVGSHTTVDCMQCHMGGFAGTPTDCEACHIADYNATSAPNHTQSGFPTDCAQCHDPSAWVPATFDHDNTGFPLTGQHASTSCLQCHANGYAGTPTECNACHMAEYNGANNPNHAADQFPTDCAECHSTTAWVPSTFDHDAMYFNIYSGNHSSVWNTCATCHTNPNDFSVFTCTDCHNNQSQLANNHSDVSGYAFNSISCYNCHN